MKNKTELTKRNLHGGGVFDNKMNLLFVEFRIPFINKITRLFHDVRILDECTNKYSGMGECYIKCMFSSDFKNVTSTTYIIDCFKYDHREEINCEDIFNDEELNIIKEEAIRIANKDIKEIF